MAVCMYVPLNQTVSNLSVYMFIYVAKVVGMPLSEGCLVVIG